MRTLLVVVIAVSSACVSVDATRIRKDLYVVSVRGNAFGGQGEAIAAANERANELCPGGYEIQDSAASSTSAYLRTSYGVQQIRKPEITIVVRCDRPEPAPQVASPPERTPRVQPGPEVQFDESGSPFVIVDHSMWCFTAADTGTAICGSTRELCERFVDGVGRGCAPADRMSCFATRGPSASREADWCFGTVDDCKRMMLAWPGPEPVARGCITLRYQAGR